MKLPVRMLCYLVGGALLLAWVDPPPGLLTFALVASIIVGAALLDHYLTRPRTAAPAEGPNVVNLLGRRQHRARRAQNSGRERRVLYKVFSSGYQSEVNTLLRMLRAKGMNPMMVLQHVGSGRGEPVYEVRLPEGEVPHARPVIQIFLMHSARTRG